MREFWRDITPNEFRCCRNPERDRPWAKTRRMSHKLWKSVHGFDLGACPIKIEYNQPNNQPTRKKSQNRNISPIWGEAPAERIEMKICTGVDLEDIMDIKFKFEKFQGFLCHWGSKFAPSH